LNDENDKDEDAWTSRIIEKPKPHTYRSMINVEGNVSD
jgi:hypothetical protein